MHNAPGITRPMPEKVSDYYGRGYLIVHAGEFMSAIRRTISSPDIFKLRCRVGSVNQFIDFDRHALESRTSQDVESVI